MISPVPRTVLSVLAGIFVSLGAYIVISLIVSVWAWGIGMVDPEMANHQFLIYLSPTTSKVFGSLFVGLVVFGVIYGKLMLQLRSQNALADTTDINTHKNDQRIAYFEEVAERYDVVGDAFSTHSVSANSILSHMMVKNKGIKNVHLVRRYQEDTIIDGITYYKGDAMFDENGYFITDELPFFDHHFSEELFDASGVLKDKRVRIYYDARKLDYNSDKSNIIKLKYDTIADLINHDFEIPEYEHGRPGGIYIVDTDPVNTMVLAITRGGKGQTYIEPMIDIWSREKRQNNFFTNDPKAELLLKNYVSLVKRGMEVIAFNLINPSRTDIFNVLYTAAESARSGNFAQCAECVQSLAGVFFPAGTGDNAMWQNAARNAFMRTAFGLIDFYLEEEYAFRRQAEKENMHPRVIDTEVDRMWGQLSLYNCYQMFTVLASKKLYNPMIALQNELAALKEAEDVSQEEIAAKQNEINIMNETEGHIWDGKAELDAMTLFFNATSGLPRSMMRTLAVDADNSLRSMAGANNMLASVYGIAVTEMKFFSDPTISALTSGPPSQNVDLSTLSFPRCIGVRFISQYMDKMKLRGLRVAWDAFADKEFTRPLDPKLFTHKDTISAEGWARFYFDGKFKNNVSYLRLRIFNGTGKDALLVRAFYFKFTKSYQKNLSSRNYVKNPITNERIVKGGILEELTIRKSPSGGKVYSLGKSYMKIKKLIAKNDGYETVMKNVPIMMQTNCRYEEKAKAIFMVTPPHLAQYAKVILVMIDQAVNQNFGQSYMIKSNQKPYYLTRFMLDELGNLQSDGTGIKSLQTLLSLGLGQGQLFTLVLQTLQQLRDIYGDSVDKIAQGNISNIVFLKSTDDTMIDTLVKMSGTTHRTSTNSKTVTFDKEAVFNKAEGKLSLTQTTIEEPVLKYNDFAFLPERNSIVLRAGDPPILNRNQTILPMSYKLLGDKRPFVPGQEAYDLQSIPSMSCAQEFDVRKNTPDFMKMLKRRMEQSKLAVSAMKMYKDVHGYTDLDIQRMDSDVYSMEIMEIVEDLRLKNLSWEKQKEEEVTRSAQLKEAVENNFDFERERQAKEQEAAVYMNKIYANGLISRQDLVEKGIHRTGLDVAITRAYQDTISYFEKDVAYQVNDKKSLFDDEGEPLIIHKDDSDEYQALRASIQRDDGLTGEDMTKVDTFIVLDAFRKHLISLSSWSEIANGEFEKRMIRECTYVDAA